jgi:hypothetical protein
MIKGISLPIDIPWKRLCASTDMMDKIAGGDHLLLSYRGPPRYNHNRPK